MSTERTQILKMLAEGKVSVEEAERLLAVVEEHTGSAAPETPVQSGKSDPKFLCVRVEPKDGRESERVNVKIPLVLVKAGIQLGGILPESAKGKVSGALGNKGIDLDLKKLDSEGVNQMIRALTETSIDVDDETESVRIYCC
ncbi:hypothetical protein GF377_01805 [candidate division GN15 bacterium]|nr:hypothetical protein [candidate division GN15 bacterium]